MCNEGYPCFLFIFSQPIVDTGGGGIREQVDLRRISLRGKTLLSFQHSLKDERIGIALAQGISIAYAY